MKSDTPRTQAAIDSIGRYLKNMDSEDSLENALAMVNQLEKLSAQLERELKEAKAKITELEKACHSKWMEGFDDGFKDGRLMERREWTSTT